jgi:hypothetical protein
MGGEPSCGLGYERVNSLSMCVRVRNLSDYDGQHLFQSGLVTRDRIRKAVVGSGPVEKAEPLSARVDNHTYLAR